MICNVPYCNAEAYFALMLYFYSDKFTKKPFTKCIVRFCDRHARQIGDKNTITRIQVLG